MILVTGGAGFIGSVLIRDLNLSGYQDIVVVDHVEDETCLNLKKAEYSKYIKAKDLFTYSDEELWSHFKYIFHIGACSSTTERNLDFLNENNVEYSKNIFRKSLKFNIPLIYASSAATYGDGTEGYSDNHEMIPNLKALNPYGDSKQQFDLWVLNQEKKPDHWFGLKYFNVFGPNEYHKGSMRSLVHKAFQQIEDVGFVKLFRSHKDGFKDGEQLRDFIYVKDTTRAMIEMMKVKDPSKSAIYNIGTGCARTFYDLVKGVFISLNKEVKVEFIDMPLEIRDQYQYFTEAETNKFKELLPDFINTNLEDAVSDYVVNYLNTKDQYY